MALDVIKALHELGVDVLVAPYEADAQLAYLNKINVAQIVITEDSDLVLFGCEKVIIYLI
jgi:exonuclease 1